MKTHSNDLFLLIKSLEPQEKRYFLLYASKNSGKSEKIFLHLFNTIASQKEYDEKKCIDLLKKKKILSDKSFSSTKKYTYDTLLKWLNVYSLEANDLNKVRSLIHSVHILKDKTLYDQAEKTLLKAKEIAYENEYLQELALIVRLQLEICHIYKKLKGKTARAQELYKELGRILHLIQIDYKYLGFYTKLIALYEINIKDDSGEKQRELSHLMRDPLLKGEKEALTQFTKKVFYNFHVQKATMDKDYLQGFHYSASYIKFIEKKPKKLKLDQKGYMAYLNNHMLFCIQCGKRKEFLVTLHKLRTLKCTTMLAKAAIFYLGTQNELSFYIQEKEYGTALSLVKKIESQLTVFRGMYGKQYEYCVWISLAELFFLTKKYRESRNWLMFFLEDEEAKESLDLYIAGRLFYLAILLESEEYFLLESQLRSVDFLFKKNNWVNPFEIFVLTFIKSEINEKSDKKKIKTELGKIKALIKNNNYKTVEDRFFSGFHFIDWAERRLHFKK